MGIAHCVQTTAMGFAKLRIGSMRADAQSPIDWLHAPPAHPFPAPPLPGNASPPQREHSANWPLVRRPLGGLRLGPPKFEDTRSPTHRPTQPRRPVARRDANAGRAGRRLRDFRGRRPRRRPAAQVEHLGGAAATTGIVCEIRVSCRCPSASNRLVELVGCCRHGGQSGANENWTHLEGEPLVNTPRRAGQESAGSPSRCASPHPGRLGLPCSQ